MVLEKYILLVLLIICNAIFSTLKVIYLNFCIDMYVFLNTTIVNKFKKVKLISSYNTNS